MTVQDRIKSEIDSNDVVLFMKGTHQFPMCGFSGQVVQILDYIGVNFKGINVLDEFSATAYRARIQVLG
mgnify:CR=1 FL=1